MSDQQRGPISFVVHGQPLPGGVPTVGKPGSTRGGTAAGGQTGVLPGRVKGAVRLGSLRGTATPQTLVAVPGEDIVALHIAGGPVLLLHPENARDLLLAQSGLPSTTPAAPGGTPRGGGPGTAHTAPAAQARAPDTVTVGATLRWQGLEASTPTRGLLGNVVLKALEVLTGFAQDQAADFAASQVVAKVDGQVEAGVYTLAPDALNKLKGSGRRMAQLPASTEPVLVFIHGTFVETTSTFGKLWLNHPQRVRQLFQHYGGRVYALEHPTLGKSPIENALELVRALPQGARLHLATHSRGGLVAEVLARMAHQRSFGAADQVFFPGAEFAAQRQQLQQLAAEMQARDVRVERVVRVACPARGTLLASRRLDAYLSVFKWAIEATGVPLVPAVLDFLAEVARRRADPTVLPGMHAMMPGTPLLNWLNAAPAAIAGELRVVAGDMEGDSLGSWLKTLLTDAYYWTDNDIVVQTSSMYAGAPRAGGASFLLDQGSKTTHFAYFVNPRTVEAVVDGLMQPQPPTGFAPIGPLSWAGKDTGGLRGERGAGAGDATKPAVFVLPGILGSNLAANGRRIWLGLRLIGGLDELSYVPGAQGSVQPDGAIGLVYDKLMRHLAATHEVVEFAYDWRLPIEQEARRLAAAVTQALDARAGTGTAVQLLAHSMGGVLARCLQLEAPAVWQRLMAHSDARLLMLGTPNGGSWAPMQVLSGDDTMGNALAAFGSPLADRQARRIMAGMPGFLQLQAGLLEPALKLDRSETWAALAQADYDRVQQANWWHRYAGEAMQAAYHWGVPPQEVLDAAKALRLRLDEQRDQVLPAFADKLLLVVGRAPATPVAFEVGEQGFVYLDAPDGDGRVPLNSALLPGVKTWQLGCEHGSLPSEASAFPAFVELLSTGSTTALQTLGSTRGPGSGQGSGQALVKSRPSRTRRSAQPARTPQSVFGDHRPDTDDGQDALATLLQLRVLNGNLSFIAEPLLVGHYPASELTGTEAVVNRMVGGTLHAALMAGLYPSEVGTHQVFTNTRTDPDNPWREPRPHSVLVVGLGEEGELREAEIAISVRQGVLSWAQRQAERRSGGAAPPHLAATLLGSGGLGISAGAAARAIARGVADANQRALAAGWPVVQRLTLVELYLDRATEAWNGLQMMAAVHGDKFALLPEIATGIGPLRRQPDSGYRGALYDLIRATTRGEGNIEFVLDSRRARTEVRSQRAQTPLLRDMVKAAATDLNDNPTLGRTLFQLLVPTEIEPFLGGAERMVLELDAGTAALPWELMDNGPGTGANASDDRRPWALRAQLMRRLQKTAAPGKARDASADHDVLIIGEPLVSPEWSELPGARAEALAVEAALMQDGALAPEKVVALVDQPDAQTVIGTLLARPWRIVHISGHGEAPTAEHDGGVVLSGKHHLGPTEIAAMRVVPELVFVNCCSLSQFDSGQALRDGFNPTEFAAVVADALIAKGVRCVIACGWPVNDGPAADFARTFYSRLLHGARFIDAVGAAREACWKAMPDGKSWAAYQCYGDPNWVYRDVTGDAQTPTPQRDEFEDIASAPALALALETLAVRARFMGGNKTELVQTLQTLAQRFEPRWGDIGAVAEAWALAWQNLGERVTAIDWYERAVRAADASASMKAEEQLLNLQAREAWAQVQASSADTVAQRGVLQKAVTALQDLAQRRPSAERLNLLGSAWKRLALLEREAGAGRQAKAAEVDEDRALRASLAAYLQADALAAAVDEAERAYPLANVWALSLCLPAGAAAFGDAERKALRAALKVKTATSPDFWSQVGQIETEMLQAVEEGQLAARRKGLQRAFVELHQQYKALRDWSSVADQAALVLGTRTRGRGAEAQAASELLALLRRHTRADEDRQEAQVPA